MATRSYRQDSRSSSRSRGASPSGSSRAQRGGAPNGLASRLSGGRLAAIFLLFVAIAVVIFGRLVWLQVIDAQNISDSGDSGRTVTVDVTPRRGTIYDRNGVVLATTVDATNVYCHPHLVPDDKKDELAKTLAQVFGDDEKKYREKIDQDTNFAYLVKSADTDKAQIIKDLAIDGVGFEDTSKRVYPCGAIGSQIIGILNSEGQGLTGLELYYDDILGGEPGKKTTEYSKEGVPVPGSTIVESEVKNGQDIVLSIDVALQEHLETALALRVEEVQGGGGSGIVMDSATGEIYACASVPLFDITDLTEVKEGATNLAGISSAFEPGSIFKPVTMLAALEEGTTQAGQVYTCPEVVYADEYTISDAHERPAEDMDTRQIMAESSNVGMSLIAHDLTFEKLYAYIQRYQITENPNTDYPGCASGYVSDWTDWSDVQGYNISFGQGIEVTPMEMVRFYGALANNGYANTPHFLLDVPTNTDKKTFDSSEIISNKQAISDLTYMMEGVVEEGTATDAQIEGYTVAGKTGTAEFASASGGYEKGVYDISFIGFLPNTSLNLVCFVGATDVPGDRKTVPAFQDIMSFAIDRYNITQK